MYRVESEPWNSRYRSIFRNKSHSSPFQCCAKSFRSIRRTSMARQTSAYCFSFRAITPKRPRTCAPPCRLQPDLWRIEALLGIAEKRTGNPREAQNHLERAFSNLDDKKIQIEAGLELIEIHSAAAQFDKALSVAGKLQELAPQNPQILLVTYEISRQMMDQSLLTMMTAAPDSAEMHMIMAGELGRQGDHPNSVAQYREALKLNPALPGAHFELAEQLRTSSDPAFNAQAEDEYKAAIRVNQYDELSWRQLGGILSAKGDFKAAEEDYRKALALQPRDSDAKTGLAIVLISTDRTDEAMSLLESAVKDDPTNIVAHYRLSTLYRRAGRTADADREMETFHHYQDVKRQAGQSLQTTGRAARRIRRCEMPSTSQYVARARAAVLSVSILGLCLYAQHCRPAAPARRTALPQLADITASTRIRFNHLASPDKKYIVESMSGGVALIDYDRDGWPDIYFTNAPDVDMQLAGKKARERALP